jgi:ABC-type phosphate/phosphonate transport system substrate-binding protein
VEGSSWEAAGLVVSAEGGTQGILAAAAEAGTVDIQDSPVVEEDNPVQDREHNLASDTDMDGKALAFQAEQDTARWVEELRRKG